jgi:hypothetical protein
MNNIKAGGKNNIKTERQRTWPTENVNLGPIGIHHWQAAISVNTVGTGFRQPD